MMEPTALPCTATTLTGESRASCWRQTQKPTINREKDTSLNTNYYQRPITQIQTPNINCGTFKSEDHQPATFDASVLENISKLWHRFLAVPHAVLLFLAGVLVKITFLLFGVGSLTEAQEEPARRRVRDYSVRIPPHMCAPSLPARPINRPIASPSNAVVPVISQRCLVPQNRPIASPSNAVVPVISQRCLIPQNRPIASPSNAVVPLKSQRCLVPTVKVNRPSNSFMSSQLRIPSVVRLNNRPTASPSNAVVPIRSHSSLVSTVNINRPSNSFLPSQLRTPSVARLKNRPIASPSSAILRSQRTLVTIKRPLNASMSAQLRNPSVVRQNNRSAASPSSAVVPVRSQRSLVPTSKSSLNYSVTSRLHTQLKLNNRPTAPPSNEVRSQRSLAPTINAFMSSQLRNSSVRLNNRPTALPPNTVVPVKSQRTSAVPHHEAILNWVITSANPGNENFPDENRSQVPINLTVPLEDFKPLQPRAYDTMKEDQNVREMCRPLSKDAVKTAKELDLLSPLAPKAVTLPQNSLLLTNRSNYCNNKELDVSTIVEIQNVKFTLTLPLAGLCEASARLCLVFRPECIVQVHCSSTDFEIVVEIMKEIGLPFSSRSPKALTSPNSSNIPKVRPVCLSTLRFKEATQNCSYEMTVQKFKEGQLVDKNVHSPTLPEREIQAATSNELLIQADSNASEIYRKCTEDYQSNNQKKTSRLRSPLGPKDVEKLEEAFARLHGRKKSCTRPSASFRHHKPLGSQPLDREQIDRLPFSGNQLLYYKKAREMRKLAAQKGHSEIRTRHLMTFQNKPNLSTKTSEQIFSSRVIAMAPLPRTSREFLQYRKMSSDGHFTGTQRRSTSKKKDNATVKNSEAILSPPLPAFRYQESARPLTASFRKLNACTTCSSNSVSSINSDTTQDANAYGVNNSLLRNTNDLPKEKKSALGSDKEKENGLKFKEVKPTPVVSAQSSELQSTLEVQKEVTSFKDAKNFNEMGQKSAGGQGSSTSDVEESDKFFQPSQDEPSVSELQASLEGLAAALRRTSNRANCAAFSFAPETEEDKDKRPSLTSQVIARAESARENAPGKEKAGLANSCGDGHSKSVKSTQSLATPSGIKTSLEAMPAALKSAASTNSCPTSSASSLREEKEQSASDDTRTGHSLSVSPGQMCATKPKLDTRETKEHRLTSSASSSGKEKEQSASVDKRTGRSHSVSSGKMSDAKPKLKARETKEDKFTQFCKEYFRRSAGSKTVLSPPSFGLIEAVNRLALANRRASISLLMKENKTLRRKRSSKRRKRQKHNKKSYRKHLKTSPSACNLLQQNSSKRDSSESAAKKEAAKGKGKPEDVDSITKGSKMNEAMRYSMKDAEKTLEVTSDVLQTANSHIQGQTVSLTVNDDTKEEKQQQQQNQAKSVGNTVDKSATAAETSSQAQNAIGFHETTAKNTELSQAMDPVQVPTIPNEYTDKTSKETVRKDPSYQPPSLSEINEAARNIKTMFSSLFVTNAQEPQTSQDGCHVNSVCSLEIRKNSDTVSLQDQITDQSNSVYRPEVEVHMNMPVSEDIDQANSFYRPEASRNINTVLPLAQESDQVTSVYQPETDNNSIATFALAQESDQVNLEARPESSQMSSAYRPVAEQNVDTAFLLTQETDIQNTNPVGMFHGSRGTAILKQNIEDQIQEEGGHDDPISYLQDNAQYEFAQHNSTGSQDPALLRYSDINLKTQAASPVIDEAKSMVQQCMDNHAAPVGEIYVGESSAMPDMEISGHFNIRQSPSGLSFHVSGDVSTSDQKLLERIQVAGNVDVQQLPTAQGLNLSTNLSIIPSISGGEINLAQDEKNGVGSMPNHDTTRVQLEEVVVDANTEVSKGGTQQEQPLYVTLIPIVQEPNGAEYISTVARPIEVECQGPGYLDAYLLPLGEEFHVPQSSGERMSVPKSEIHSDVQQKEEVQANKLSEQEVKTAKYFEACRLLSGEQPSVPGSAGEGISLPNDEIHSDVHQREEEFQANKLSEQEVKRTAEYFEACLSLPGEQSSVPGSAGEGISIPNDEIHSDVLQRDDEFQASKLSALERKTKEDRVLVPQHNTDIYIKEHEAEQIQTRQLSPVEVTTAATATSVVTPPASEDYLKKSTQLPEEVVNFSEYGNQVTSASAVSVQRTVASDLPPKVSITEHQTCEYNIPFSRTLSAAQEEILTQHSASQDPLKTTKLTPKTPEQSFSTEKFEESLLRIYTPNGQSREVDQVVMSRAAELIEKGVFVLSDTGTINAIVDPNRVTREDGNPQKCAFSSTFNHYTKLPTQFQEKIIRSAQNEGLDNRVVTAESIRKPVFAKAKETTVRGQIIEDRDGDQIMLEAHKPNLSETHYQMANYLYQPCVPDAVAPQMGCYYYKELQRNVDIDMMSDGQESLMDIASGGNSQTSLMECEDCTDQIMGQYCHFCKEMQRQKSLTSSLPIIHVPEQPKATLFQNHSEKQAPVLPTPGNQTSYSVAGIDGFQATVAAGCSAQTSFFSPPCSVEQPGPPYTGTQALLPSSNNVQSNVEGVLIPESQFPTIQGTCAVQDVLTIAPKIVKGLETLENTDASCYPNPPTQNTEARDKDNTPSFSDVEASPENTNGKQESEGPSPVAPSILDLCASVDIEKLVKKSNPVAKSLKDPEDYGNSTDALPVENRTDNDERFTEGHSDFDITCINERAGDQLKFKCSLETSLSEVDAAASRSNELSRIGTSGTFLGGNAPSLEKTLDQPLRLVQATASDQTTRTSVKCSLENETSSNSEKTITKLVASKDEKPLPEMPSDKKCFTSSNENQVGGVSKQHLAPFKALPQVNEEGTSIVGIRRKVIVPRKRVLPSSAERKVVAFGDLFGAADNRRGPKATSLSGKKRLREAINEVSYSEPESSTELKRRRKVHFSDEVQVREINTLPNQFHSSSCVIAKPAGPRKGILKNSKSRMAKG